MAKASPKQSISSRAYKVKHHDRLLQDGKNYYWQHREEILAKQKAKNAANPEPNRRRAREYAQNNPEKVAERRRQYRANNQGKIKAYTKKYYEENAEEQRKRSREQKTKNPQQHASHEAKRRAVKANAPRVERVSLTTIYARDRKTCSICHQYVPRRQASIDHIVPLSHGGEHSYRNCALARRLCNSRKSNRSRPPQQLGLFYGSS